MGVGSMKLDFKKDEEFKILLLKLIKKYFPIENNDWNEFKCYIKKENHAYCLHNLQLTRWPLMNNFSNETLKITSMFVDEREEIEK